MMKLIIYSLFLLGLFGVNANQDYTLCYKCASNYIVYQWENVYLKRNLLYGGDISGDQTCLNSTYSQESIRCIGKCGLFRVLAERDGKTFTFGTYRDCASNNAFKDLMDKMEESSNQIEIPLKTVQSYTRKVLFEVCDGDYCNSEHKTQIRYLPRGPMKNNAKSISIYGLPIFICSIITLYLNF